MKPGDRGEEVKAVQELLRANGYQISADGIWGPRSAEALRTFQRAQGLRVTGQPDEATMAALRGEIQTPRTVPTIGGFGLWVDNLPARRGGVWDWDGWARDLVDTGADNFSLVTFGQPTLAIPAWWTAERLAAAAAVLRHAGWQAGRPPRVGWLFWADARRNTQSIEVYERLLEDAAQYDRMHLPDYLEADAEEASDDITTQQADQWVQMAKRFDGCEVQVTAVLNNNTGLGHARPWVEAVEARADHARLRPQVYTAYLPNKAWTKYALFRPGVFQQQLADDLARLIERHPKLLIEQGAALYGQAHPKPFAQGVEALKVSRQAALDTAHMWSPSYAPRWMYWSSKAISPQVRAWLQTLPR